MMEAIKKKQKEGHEVFIALDGNEKIIQDRGGILRLYHEYKLYDPFTHLHGKECETNSQIRGSYRIDYYLCTYNLLKRIKLCGMTGFNDITSSDHYGFFLDVQSEAITNPKPSQHHLRSNESYTPNFPSYKNL